MRFAIAILGLTALATSSGCSSNAEHVQALKDALAKAELSLADAVAIAETDHARGIGYRAELLAQGSPVFSVGSFAAALHDIQVDGINGEVLAATSSGGSVNACPNAVSLNAAIAAAEGEVSGEAVAIAPDDDGECNREVKVLSGDTLWEVKVAPDGSIVESEEDDEG